MFKRISYYLFIFYCFEIGIFLFVVPWWLPQVWNNNYFFFFVPALKEVFLSGFFRGAISGLGLLNILMGISEIFHNEKLRRSMESN
jgi:hypothetical protein